MRTINFNQRQARVLRENLTQNTKGYDTLDLFRLDHLAKKLTELQGEYAEKMAALIREERQLRREIARKTNVDGNTERLIDMTYEVQDLHELAETVPVSFTVEDGDYNLIKNKLDSETGWLASDEIRSIVIGMLEAMQNAERSEVNGEAKPSEVKQFRRK